MLLQQTPDNLVQVPPKDGFLQTFNAHLPDFVDSLGFAKAGRQDNGQIRAQALEFTGQFQTRNQG
jgi:hypothetical protein